MSREWDELDEAYEQIDRILMWNCDPTACHLDGCDGCPTNEKLMSLVERVKELEEGKAQATPEGKPEASMGGRA